jgi:uncharacterized protein (TIGR03435 family)
MIPAQLQPLIDHVWQSTVFAMLAGALTLAVRKNRAQIRYWLWFTASVKFLIPFSLLAGIGSYLRPHSIGRVVPSGLPVMVQNFTESFVVSPSIVMAATPARAALSANLILVTLGMIWAIGFIVLVSFWCGRWSGVRAMLKTASPVQLPINLRAMSSPAFGEPGVFGIYNPILLVPEGITERLTAQQLQAILDHEMCHVRRRDNLGTAIHMVVEAVFWFHPLVWFLGTRLMDERERACDEEVLRAGNQPCVYAEGVLKVCELYLQSPLRCMSGVTGSNLTTRIKSIAAGRIGRDLSFSRKTILVTAGTIALAVPIAAGVIHGTPAQSSKPSFEVASIKPWKLTNPDSREGQLLAHGGDPFDGRMNPNGRLTATAVTLRRLISWAYNVRTERIAGGPAWVDSERYDIEAKAPDGAMRAGEVSVRYEQMHLMLQSLLSERFGLKLHTDPKEFPVYALVVAKNGPKLQKADRDCSSPLTGSEVLCHGFTGGGPRVGQTGQSVTMVEVAAFLTPHLDRPVVDRTGISGMFDLKFPPWNPYLQGVPEGATQDGNSREGKAVDFNSVPTLFTLVEQQFGLKLEGSRAKLDTLVIDSAQIPAKN